MRTCQSCGAENPPDRDFCSCGEYLRWEPTGYMQAITPDMAAEAAAVSADAANQVAPPPAPEPAAPAPPPPAPGGAQVTPAVPPAPGGGNGHGQPAAPPPPPPAPTAAPVPAVTQQPAVPARPVNKTLVRGAVPAQPPAAAPPQQHEPATIVLRLPDGEYAKGETLHQAVEPGQRDRVLALIRNQSGIVDNYDLRVEGLPQDWWSIYPGTVYLVPFGSGGTYEQEVEIHLHPPRGPEAEARVWDLQIVADSKAHLTVAATAPLALHIAPYIETVDLAAPATQEGPQEGRLRRHGDQQGQRAGARRARRRGSRRRAAVRLQPPAAGDPARRRGHLADAGQAAEADLDRARDRTAASRSRPSRARRPPRAPRPSR